MFIGKTNIDCPKNLPMSWLCYEDYPTALNSPIIVEIISVSRTTFLVKVESMWIQNHGFLLSLCEGFQLTH